MARLVQALTLCLMLAACGQTDSAQDCVSSVVAGDGALQKVQHDAHEELGPFPQEDGSYFPIQSLVPSLTKQAEHLDQQAIILTSYVEGMDGLDLLACPPDFQEAFVEHTSAWAAQASLVTQLAQIQWQRVQAASQGNPAAFDSLAPAFNATQHQLDSDSDIDTTWRRVKLAALRAGVSVE